MPFPKGHPMRKIRADMSDSYRNMLLMEARIAQGLTKRELTERSGLSLATVHAYERMQRFPSAENRRKVAEQLGTTQEQVFPESIREITHLINQKERYTPFESLDNGFKGYDGILDRRDYAVPTVYYAGLRRKLRTLLGILSYREREVLSLRYGLGGTQPYRLEDIGKVFGFSKQRANQTEERAIRKLRALNTRGLRKLKVSA